MAVRIQISYDPEADILFIKLKDRHPVESEHFENDVIVDYDKNNDIVAVEILDFKRRSQEGFIFQMEDVSL